MASGQLAKIVSILERHKRLFDLREDRLGEDLCRAATDGVQGCLATETDPDGVPWAPLSEKYEEVKRFQYPGQPIGVLHGIMADPREVAGVVIVTSTWAKVTYGRSARAREEASWFQEGNAHQPPRRFWGFTRESRDRAREILDARFRTL